MRACRAASPEACGGWCTAGSARPCRRRRMQSLRRGRRRRRLPRAPARACPSLWLCRRMRHMAARNPAVGGERGQGERAAPGPDAPVMRREAKRGRRGPPAACRPRAAPRSGRRGAAADPGACRGRARLTTQEKNSLLNQSSSAWTNTSSCPKSSASPSSAFSWIVAAASARRRAKGAARRAAACAAASSHCVRGAGPGLMIWGREAAWGRGVRGLRMQAHGRMHAPQGGRTLRALLTSRPSASTSAARCAAACSSAAICAASSASASIVGQRRRVAGRRRAQMLG